jgi:hypothetical protein
VKYRILACPGCCAASSARYLSISPNGGRRWVFLFRWQGKPTEIGFGSARDVTLARARELATQARAKLAEGSNPRGARRATEGATFGECADQVIEAMSPSWRNGKHAAQWKMTLRNYAGAIRGIPVANPPELFQGYDKCMLS